MRYYLLIVWIAFTGQIYAQTGTIRQTRLPAAKDTLFFHSTPVNPSFFQVLFHNSLLPDSLYSVDFTKARIILNNNWKKSAINNTDTIIVKYRIYPEFLTRTYQTYDTSRIYPSSLLGKPVKVQNLMKDAKPWQGLQTTGNITRGITVGNNRDALLESEMDLTISGKLSPDVELQARIKDTNIPLQEDGYSQDLKDLDRIYMRLKGPYWNITAGDIMMRNNQTRFLNFQKKISGVSFDFLIDSIDISASAAKVKGRYTEFRFQGQEGNQGPYKLMGAGGENYIFIISGSEQVYINGVLKTRGIDKDYIIDYQSAEITFNPSFPINSDMRVEVKYQYSDRNYARFVTFNSAGYRVGDWQSKVFFYSEQDIKTQPVQLNLSAEQISQIASEASAEGPVYIENAVETPFDVNLILYRRVQEGYFEYSTDPSETLYTVGFSYFGEGKGDYIISSYQAAGRIMQYVGENQGDYKALIPITPPSRQQMWVVQNRFDNAKTNLYTEIAYAQNNSNLFSNSTNVQNHAPAFKVDWQQTLMDSTSRKWFIQSRLKWDFIKNNFKAPENIDPVEFERNWNLTGYSADRNQTSWEIYLSKNNRKSLKYGFEYLGFSGQYKGYKNFLKSNWSSRQFEFYQNTHYLLSEDKIQNGSFLSHSSGVIWKNDNAFTRIGLNIEENKLRNHRNAPLLPQSFRFTETSFEAGLGDSTRVFVKTGFTVRHTDSIQGNILKENRQSRTWYISGRPVKNEHNLLEWNLNYRKIFIKDSLTKPFINADIKYSAKLAKGMINWQTRYENYSGNIIRQEYTYIHTEPGQGYYTWNDYNENGIPDPDEFEIALYNDQADYLRIALPNTRYLPTRKASLRQNIIINLSHWKNNPGFLSLLSHLNGGLSLHVSDDRLHQSNELHWNPFKSGTADRVAKKYTYSSHVVWRGLTKPYSLGYRYEEAMQEQVDIFGKNSSGIYKHRMNAQFEIFPQATFRMSYILESENSSHDVYYNKNYRIHKTTLLPSCRYIFGKQHAIDLSLSYGKQNNLFAGRETNNRTKWELDYRFDGVRNGSISLTINILFNDFTGNDKSPVAYTMLEGLQPGRNYTWNMIWTEKLNSFLYLHLLYDGRSSKESKTTIHNGSIKLTAGF